MGDFQRALKIIIKAELFIVMIISPGQLRYNITLIMQKMLIHDHTPLTVTPRLHLPDEG